MGERRGEERQRAGFSPVKSVKKKKENSLNINFQLERSRTARVDTLSLKLELLVLLITDFQRFCFLSCEAVYLLGLVKTLARSSLL